MGFIDILLMILIVSWALYIIWRRSTKNPVEKSQKKAEPDNIQLYF